MKKSLLTIIASLAFLFNAPQAQCDVDNLAINLHSATMINGQCQVFFDFSWTQDVNSGNKFAVIHFWRSDQYPALEEKGLAYNPPSDRPTAEDLQDCLTTIIIEDNGTDPHIGTTYYPDTSVRVLSAGLVVDKETTATPGVFRMTVKNITFSIPNCTGIGLTGDVWASESAHGQNVHCVKSNVTMIIGNPRVTGLMYCLSPRKYSTQISNVGTDSITVYYNLYIDEGDAVFEPTAHDLKVITSSSMSLIQGEIYSSGPQDYPNAGIKPYSDRGLWVEVVTTGHPNTSIYFIANTCTPLPVNFGNFLAKRDRSVVHLSWETLTETDNRGFEVQRKTGSEDFRTVAFIATKATDGNSTDMLSYVYDDQNSATTVSIYRLRQIDINGRSSFSEYRAVGGLDNQKFLFVYPNPVRQGNLYLVFADPSKSYDVALLDQQGRMIRQWRKFNKYHLDMGSIQPGVYILRAVDPLSNKTEQIKLVITE